MSKGQREVEKIESRESFTAFMERYRNLVFSICVKMTGDYFAAEDLSQETFLSAYRRWGAFDGADGKAWIARIAANKCTDYLRSAARRSIAADPEELPEQEAPGADPQQWYITREVQTQVRNACQELPPKYAAAATAFYLENSTAREIAEGTGENLKTVQTRIQRAKTMLRKKLQEGGVLP